MLKLTKIVFAKLTFKIFLTFLGLLGDFFGGFFGGILEGYFCLFFIFCGIFCWIFWIFLDFLEI